MRVDALGLLANKTVARIADKVVPCGRGLRLLLLASPYLDILTEHYRFLYVNGILNQKTTKIDLIKNKGIADFTR